VKVEATEETKLGSKGSMVLQLFSDVFYMINAVFKDIKHDMFGKHQREDGDAFKTPAELVMADGYQFEEHKVVTPDGYILTAWRIPGKLGANFVPKQPVILQHGLLDNSFTWLVNNSTLNLPFMLADEGYDVWLTNNRGNIISDEHIDERVYNYNKNTGKYWDFSFDEMGIYDIKSHFQYIQKDTGYEKIVYIGHSQGTTQVFAAISDDPSFANSFKQFIGLGPVIYVNHLQSSLIYLLDVTRFPDALEALGLKRVLLLGQKLHTVMRTACYYFPNTCVAVVSMICGRDTILEIDPARMAVMGDHEPGGTSAQNLLHWIQMVRHGEFAKYNYGKKENMKHYGTPQPPNYQVSNLAQLSVPTYLFVGLKDYLVDKKDFARLQALLPTDQNEVIVKELPNFAHLDYVWSWNAKTEIYDEIIPFLRKYNPQN